MSNSSNVPRPKRRRILDPSAVVPVQIYSNQVGSRLQLKPPAPVFSHITPTDTDQGHLLHSPTHDVAAVVIDSDEDDLQIRSLQTKSHERAAVRCPSPPSESPVQKQSTKAKRKLIEINRKLEAITSSPPPEIRTRTQRRRQLQSPTAEEDDDIIVVGSMPSLNTDVSSPREIPLKIRCRTDVHKVPVLPTTPLREVIHQLSVLLQVPAARLLLLRKEVELLADSTVAALGLGIADIIDCVVMATEKGESRSSSNNSDNSDGITIRLQGNDSLQDFTVQRDAPLDSVFSRYVSSLPDNLRKKVRFHLDGSRVTGSATPAQLDLEDGDIIEVWT
ncbi:NFATC2-interacting protein [Neosynchiropus ocellatus]